MSHFSPLIYCFSLTIPSPFPFFFFFFNDTATTEIYTLFPTRRSSDLPPDSSRRHRFSAEGNKGKSSRRQFLRSEEHTSELQSHSDLVCRLLLEKKKKISIKTETINAISACVVV